MGVALVPMMSSEHDVTALLHDWCHGNAAVKDQLFELVYDAMRKLARSHLRRERADHTLQPTALVHEAYVRLVDQTRGEWRDRVHFLAIAATAMRRILVDHARRHRAGKRGGAGRPLSLESVEELPIVDRAEFLVHLDEALARLATLDERQARVVECRFFGGYTEEETAETLGVGLRTVKRDWAKARSWLFQELYPDASTPNLSALARH